MPAIPPNLLARFEECLRNKPIPKNLHGAYKKWLRSLLSKNGFFTTRYARGTLRTTEKKSYMICRRDRADKSCILSGKLRI